MTLEYTANEDMTVRFTNPPTGTPPSIPVDALPATNSDVGIDAVKVVPILSTKCKATGKKVGTTGITVTWTAISGCAFTSATYTFTSGAGTVVPSATKTKAEGQLVLREGDVGTCAGGWTLTALPNTPVVCACKVEIIDAGQAKDKAQ